MAAARGLHGLQGTVGTGRVTAWGSLARAGYCRGGIPVHSEQLGLPTVSQRKGMPCDVAALSKAPTRRLLQIKTQQLTS